MNVRLNGGFFLFFVVRSAVPDEAVIVFDCEMRSTSVNIFFFLNVLLGELDDDDDDV